MYVSPTTSTAPLTLQIIALLGSMQLCVCLFFMCECTASCIRTDVFTIDPFQTPSLKHAHTSLTQVNYHFRREKAPHHLTERKKKQPVFFTDMCILLESEEPFPVQYWCMVIQQVDINNSDIDLAWLGLGGGRKSNCATEILTFKLRSLVWTRAGPYGWRMYHDVSVS